MPAPVLQPDKPTHGVQSLIQAPAPERVDSEDQPQLAQRLLQFESLLADLSGKFIHMPADRIDFGNLKGAILLQPSVHFVHEPFRFMVQYSTIMGSFANFGVFRDRDQVSLSFTHLLN